MPELAVSSWSLHRALGPVYAGLAAAGDERGPTQPYGPGELTLLEAPAQAAALGVSSLEICQFHFPTTAPEYLDELCGRFEAAGVRFLTLLIDAGDITASDPAARERELAGIERWIDVAARSGARQARVIAGDARADPGGAALRASIDGLSRLAAHGRRRGVGVITENWRQLATAPADLLAILDGAGGTVGLCADFGNYKGPDKYDDLRAILPRAGTIHAKAHFSAPGVMDAEDFRRCLDLARAAGFGGEYVLIFDGPGDERASLAQMAEFVRPYL
jgi:sugar phosphate isomerase/epimerase